MKNVIPDKKMVTDMFDTLLEFCNEKQQLIDGGETDQYTFSPEALHCGCVNIEAQLRDRLSPESPMKSEERRWSDSDVKKLLEDYRVANREIYLNPVIWFDKLNDEK